MSLFCLTRCHPTVAEPILSRDSRYSTAKPLIYQRTQKNPCLAHPRQARAEKGGTIATIMSEHGTPTSPRSSMSIPAISKVKKESRHANVRPSKHPRVRMSRQADR